ncbi:phosphatase PAP2 family protein [Winogradskya humida]|uniref:Phosphatidic acid phosphatase type 2/haloperoxidase domain-containing protein n=1 Tax=Winogradskya humida TaxID=113566 RepID=A0ABQ3ZHN0_9ACTN|nr:phosphatase PAP2 family protein [Actinoplanes humidus]GIE18094.1 hypothetical protein Ahu01nite_011960 [Actinoplanes humidus]
MTSRLLWFPAAGFVLLTLAVSRFDIWISAGAHTAALAHPAWRAVMDAVTLTGGTPMIGPLVAFGCLLLLMRGHWRQALFAATAMVVTLTVRLGILGLVARPRPVDRLAPASNYSFPSGHSTASAAAALILVIVCLPSLRHRWSRAALVIMAGLWALAVGVSRVALVVHWPTDVLGAWLLVLVVVPATGLLLDKLPGPRRAEEHDQDPDGVRDPDGDFERRRAGREVDGRRE